MLIPTVKVRVLKAVVDVRPSDALVHFVLVDVSEFPPIMIELKTAEAYGTVWNYKIN
jgi:hypothetical protein